MTTAAPDLVDVAPLKPGIATTEFWAVVITAGISLAVALGWIGPDFAKKHEDLVNALALLAATIGPGLYAIARGIAKRGPVARPVTVNRVTAATGAGGFAVLLVIALVLVVVGAILLIAAAANGDTTLPPYVPGIVLVAVGVVLLLVRGSGGRVTL